MKYIKVKTIIELAIINSGFAVSMIQGQSTQTFFSKLALRDRNLQVRVFWKVILKSWDLRNFGTMIYNK